MKKKSARHLARLIGLKLALIVCLGGSFSTKANLVITPVFDSSITSDANASLITNTILQAIAVYQATFSDNVTATINFKKVSSGLGGSSSYRNTISYSLYRSQLSADRTTVTDTNALSRLTNTSTNPVNGSTQVHVNLPQGRAIGLTGVTMDGLGNNVGWNPPAGEPDGYVDLNTSLMNLSRAVTNNSKYDLLGVAEHEINEILGFSSALDGLTNGEVSPTGAVDSLDFYRYDQNNARSFNTVSNAQAYFSINGVTRLVRFNQYAGGDFQDFFSWPSGGIPPRVQDAFSTAGATPSMNVELIALDVIGYNLLVPKMSITKVSTNKETISWFPAPPGYVLQEITNLASTNWLNSINGTNNPTTVTNLVPVKFYRLNHP